MRASRHLKPETFPFLAVLLCALGSLILMLLVMDRRAKAVARAKAARAALQLTGEQEKRRAEEEKRRAEARRLREQAAAVLLEEENRLREQVEAARSRTEAAAAESTAAEGKAREMQARLQSEQQALSQDEEAAKAARARASAAAGEVERVRTEAAKLATDLERLERQLAALKAKRQREQQTYSLVPYRGKHGDNRKPLYLECGPHGLVFHPDRLALEGADLTVGRLREEVERRVARLTDGKTKRGKEPVYLFFLVRPDGINRYYETVAALSGLEVDFGYELVEQDWVLDFSESAGPSRQWAESSAPAAAPTPSMGTTGRSGGAPRGITFGKPEPPPVPPPPPRGGGGEAANRQPGLSPGSLSPPGTGTGQPGGVPRSLPGVLGPFVEPPPARPSNGGSAAASDAEPPPQAKASTSGAEGDPSPGLPGMPAEKDTPKPRVVGNRELVFRVECKADEVVLYPGGARFATSLVGNEDGPQALAKALQQMIARRQAGLRPGEAPYRPQVRFLVRPDGLRSFFLAYPAVEPLKVPMTRQDLQADDELP